MPAEGRCSPRGRRPQSPPYLIDTRAPCVLASQRASLSSGERRSAKPSELVEQVAVVRVHDAERGPEQRSLAIDHEPAGAVAPRDVEATGPEEAKDVAPPRIWAVVL